MAGLITPLPGGRKPPESHLCSEREHREPPTVDVSFTQGEPAMHSIIYIVGLIVIILAILSFLGMR